jgi:hypothetical protein
MAVIHTFRSTRECVSSWFSPTGLVHHMETWVTQREIWRRTSEGWKLYRVDSIRDQRRLIDGQPG